ncbi:MAG TPA: DUF6438 domain-containing protein [Kofleriaceae bacterium]
MSRLLVLVTLIAGCDAGAKPTPPQPLAAPVEKPPEVHEHVLLASIDRGACYGTCPIYTLAVYRDGKVEYEGKDFVVTKGQASGTVTAAQLAALDKLFTEDHFLAYNSKYTSYDVTDESSARTAYRPLGATETKTVDHYYGDMKAPESLTKLEERFDAIVQSERWIGTRAERDKLDGR